MGIYTKPNWSDHLFFAHPYFPFLLLMNDVVNVLTSFHKLKFVLNVSPFYDFHQVVGGHPKIFL